MEKAEPTEMKNAPSGPNRSPDDSRNEIEALKTEEAANGLSVNLAEVNVDDLASQDLTMWRMFKRSGQNGNGGFSLAFKDYQAQIFEKGNASQKAFAAFLANELSKRPTKG